MKDQLREPFTSIGEMVRPREWIRVLRNITADSLGVNFANRFEFDMHCRLYGKSRPEGLQIATCNL